MHAERLLVRRRRQGERVVLVVALRQARDARPLTRQVVEVVWLHEFDVRHIWIKQMKTTAQRVQSQAGLPELCFVPNNFVDFLFWSRD